MNEDISALLKVHDYFHGASDAALKDVMDAGQIRTFAAGEIVHQPQDPVVSVYFVLRGRLKSVKVDPLSPHAAGRPVVPSVQVPPRAL